MLGDRLGSVCFGSALSVFVVCFIGDVLCVVILALRFRFGLVRWCGVGLWRSPWLVFQLVFVLVVVSTALILA